MFLKPVTLNLKVILNWFRIGTITWEICSYLGLKTSSCSSNLLLNQMIVRQLVWHQHYCFISPWQIDVCMPICFLLNRTFIFKTIVSGILFQLLTVYFTPKFKVFVFCSWVYCHETSWTFMVHLAGHKWCT